ncbi:uncharacterized protein M421DRAFT_427146 [Didymella exigua CBS 183.55]|uniref:Uncharacterized protein n=1 Tax=Didymella exigua CBS 183.55 TaxID=1150837 RepID=A0A6A5R668_9PLEO|nr:uncharacterized protein M421DRAFT_427146 [Didymella exigua CBS 183.55]KAF1922226.1 hypothetical protein M421DRAFT_427146 [Didymella exigua CBS 183.55]
MELVWDSQANNSGSSENNTANSHRWPQQLTLSNSNNVFCFLEGFSVIVCKQHYTAVVSLDAHLRKYHAASAALRRQILDAIELPEEPAQPIEELGKPLDGAQCETCS